MLAITAMLAAAYYFFVNVKNNSFFLKVYNKFDWSRSKVKVTCGKTSSTTDLNLKL